MSTRAQRAARRGAKKEGDSNAAAAAAPAAPAATFNDLPDELALRIFSCLGLHTRVGVAALVCIRWHTLTHSLPLLRTVEARIRGTPARTLSEAATSFCDWFYGRAAPLTERLHVVLPFDYGPYEATTNDVDFAMAELTATLCGAADEFDLCLRDLQVTHWFEDHDWCIPERCWGLSSLERLRIHTPKSCFGFNCLPDSLPLLKDLELVGFGDLRSSALGRCHSLPRSLTHLRLPMDSDYWEDGPPGQIQGLPDLQSLVLQECPWEADTYDDLLEHYPGLKRLGLIKCREVPLCLGSLIRLELLHLSATPEHECQDDADQLAQALPQLSRLTGLIINHSERLWHRADLARALHDLPLQHLSMLGADPQHGEPPLRLPPPGRWQAQLRELTLPAATAAAALPQLAAATRLEALTLLHLCSIPAEQQEALLAFAAGHPSLRRLRLDASGPHLSAATFAAVSGALRANRALRLLPGLSSGDAGRLAEEAWEACCGGGSGE